MLLQAVARAVPERRARRPREASSTGRSPSADWPAERCVAHAARRRSRPAERPALRFDNGSAASARTAASTWSCSTATTRRRCRGCNVLANPGFGSSCPRSGSAFTWAENSRENRLTPFANDPVGDPTARRSSSATTSAGTSGARRRGRCAAPGRRAASSCRHARRRHALRARERRHPPASSRCSWRRAIRSSSRC